MARGTDPGRARWGEPADVGGAVVFLASRTASYVHGYVLVVDGGWLPSASIAASPRPRGTRDGRK
ncbi:SDR family oxidoreductase [Xylanimonas sp. McL0601]|uniref:SDR family oxidoreductase n=1 Tax=Xylanimonas sp. McL0601 TaxID=3414739 RepID=UPI003CEEA010